MSYLMSNYAPLAVTFTKGEGCYLTDTQGEKYSCGRKGCHGATMKTLIGR
jgi:acetylornithine/succinyldiaminopimelate/putrescine aminotransferase